jgi:hypothetical protein
MSDVTVNVTEQVEEITVNVYEGKKVDPALSATSTNPVQNKVVDLELKTKKNYCGFENRTDSVITAADSGGWKVTIAPVTTSFNVWAGKAKRTFTTSQVVSVPTDLTLYFIYVDESGAFAVSTTPWDIDSDNAPAAIFYREGTDYALTDERHSYRRNTVWHNWAHNNIGAMYKSGLTGTFLDSTFSIAQGVIADEDINFDTGEAKTTTTHWHRATTLDRMRLVRNNTTIYPVVGGQMAYDLDGVLTAMDANRYGVYWVYASNDPEEPIYTVVTQAQYTNLTLARNAAAPTIYLSTAEWKLLYRVIYRNTDPITYIEAADFRTVQTGTPISATTQDHSAQINRDAANAHPATAITFTIEEITGADTLTAADSGKHFYSTAAADIDVTIDAGLTHPISIFQKGNGVVTVISGSGTPTLLGNVKTNGQNTAIAIVPESTTVYEVIGGIA